MINAATNLLLIIALLLNVVTANAHNRSESYSNWRLQGLEISTIIESDIPDEFIKLPLDESNSIIKTCPKCKTKIRLPKGKSGKVNCPNCGERFHTAT